VADSVGSSLAQKGGRPAVGAAGLVDGAIEPQRRPLRQASATAKKVARVEIPKAIRVWQR